MGTELLIDNSAWFRLYDPALPVARADEIADEFAAERIVTCGPFLLEAGYSARSGGDHQEIMSELTALPFLAIDGGIEKRALDAQAQLARIGHHRLPVVDLLLAAIADHHQIGVLHYDGDFEVIRTKTDLDFRSEWLVPRGSL
ncbi:MAG TPA: PIN domain-containing protein [Solirubrobacterales bacterium]|nr:PIN domain-containing protein [Solirubrobacterales bacterium]